MRLESNRTNFTGIKPIVVSNKNNKNMPYLFNRMDDIVKEHHIPSVFETHEGRMVLEPPTSKIAKAVTETIKKFGIVISDFKK